MGLDVANHIEPVRMLVRAFWRAVTVGLVGISAWQSFSSRWQSQPSRWGREVCYFAQSPFWSQDNPRWIKDLDPNIDNIDQTRISLNKTGIYFNSIMMLILIATGAELSQLRAGHHRGPRARRDWGQHRWRHLWNIPGIIQHWHY